MLIESAVAAPLKWPCLNSARPRFNCRPGILGFKLQGLAIGGRCFIEFLLPGQIESEASEGCCIGRIAHCDGFPGLGSICPFLLLL